MLAASGVSLVFFLSVWHSNTHSEQLWPVSAPSTEHRASNPLWPQRWEKRDQSRKRSASPSRTPLGKLVINAVLCSQETGTRYRGDKRQAEIESHRLKIPTSLIPGTSFQQGPEVDLIRVKHVLLGGYPTAQLEDTDQEELNLTFSSREQLCLLLQHFPWADQSGLINNTEAEPLIPLVRLQFLDL